MWGEETINYYLIDAKESDRAVVQETLDGYEAGHSGKVEISDLPLESRSSNDICLDLRIEGTIRIYDCDGEGSVTYQTEDRSILLRQLVLMTSGYRYKDADWKSYMIGKENNFRWVSNTEHDISDKAFELIKEMLETDTAREHSLFMQICDCNLDTQDSILEPLGEYDPPCTAVFDYQTVITKNDVSIFDFEDTDGGVSLFSAVF